MGLKQYSWSITIVVMVVVVVVMMMMMMMTTVVVVVVVYSSSSSSSSSIGSCGMCSEVSVCHFTKYWIWKNDL